jgi:hypothetical protein
MSLIKIFKKLLRKEEVIDNIVNINIDDILPSKEEVFLQLPQIRIINKYDPNKPSILLIDDAKGIISIVEDYIAACNVDMNSYNLLTFFGFYAPFVMEETLEILKTKGLYKIDYAIVDLVLPGKIKTGDVYIKKDGVDVAEYISKNFNCTNFCFYSGNVLKAYEDFVREKSERFKKIFGTNFEEYVIFKGDNSDEDTVKEFCKLLRKEKYFVSQYLTNENNL